MRNIFKEEADERANSYYNFSWEALGDLQEGRQQLGSDMPVMVYRLLLFTMTHVLFENYGAEKTNELFREAGHLAGGEMAKHLLPMKKEFGEFMSALQKMLKELKISILRVEYADLDKGEVVMAMYEDLDCSGLPASQEMVCHYDEGFLAGVLEAYAGKKFTVREVDCWANGDRACRFEGKRQDD